MKDILCGAERSSWWGGMILALAIFGTPHAGAATTVGELRCEHLTDPLGIDSVRPNLSWVMLSSERAQKQTAFQVLVASAPSKLEANQADLWDSGRVATDETVQAPYGGTPLTSRQQCSWKVRVWDRQGQVLRESNGPVGDGLAPTR